MRVVSQSTPDQVVWDPEDLGVGEVLAEVAQFPGQLVHHLLEDHRVHVLAEHVEEEPVAHVGLFDDCVDDLSADEPEPDVEEVGAHLGAEDDDEPVEDDQETQQRQQDKPKHRNNYFNFIKSFKLPI